MFFLVAVDAETTICILIVARTAFRFIYHLIYMTTGWVHSRLE